jgi:phage regulator Rha-like protein
MQDLKDKIEVISGAINEQLQVRFFYKLETESRLINSHCIYENSKGAIMLDAFQESGQTDTNNQQFKCFVVQHMSKVIVVVNSFEENEKFNFASDRYTNAICRIGG